MRTSRSIFRHIPDLAYWPEYVGMTVVPDPQICRSTEGKLKSMSLHNEMDIVEDRGVVTCGICKEMVTIGINVREGKRNSNCELGFP